MNRFTRSPGKPAGPTKINFAAAKKAILLDPGVYELQIERAELVARGNTSVALTLTHIASGQVVSTRPMWVAGRTPGPATWPNSIGPSSRISYG